MDLSLNSFSPINMNTLKAIVIGLEFKITEVDRNTLAWQSNHERLQRIHVERRQAIERELYARILQDIRDEVLSNDWYGGWIEESDW